MIQQRGLAVAFGLLLSLAVGVAVLLGAPDPSGDRRSYEPVIDPAVFSTIITNPYLPLAPGNRWVYEGQSEDGFERRVFEVTDETRTVMGVRCVVVRDVVTLDGEAYEDTEDWFAQDREGTVWYFGEATRKRRADGSFNPAGSWEAGVDGALPGVVMPARPAPGDQFRTEYLPGEAEDMARVLSVNKTLRAHFGFFQDVLVTRDWSPLDPGVTEHKHYAAGIGLVREEAVEGEPYRSDLVDFKTR